MASNNPEHLQVIVRSNATTSSKCITRPPRHVPYITFILTTRRRSRVITNTRPHVTVQRSLPFTTARTGRRATMQPTRIARRLTIHNHTRFRERFRSTIISTVNSYHHTTLHTRMPFRRLTMSQFHARRIKSRRYSRHSNNSQRRIHRYTKRFRNRRGQHSQYFRKHNRHTHRRTCQRGHRKVKQRITRLIRHLTTSATNR